MYKIAIYFSMFSAIVFSVLFLTKLRPHLFRSTSLPSSDTCILSAAGNILSTTIRSGRRRLYHHVIHGEIQSAPHLLWKARREDSQQDTAIPRVTSMLPIEVDHIILAFSKPLLVFRMPYSAEGPALFRRWPYSSLVLG